MLEIKVTQTTTPKAKPDENNLGFGTHYTDHLFRMDYTEGQIVLSAHLAGPCRHGLPLCPGKL